MIWDSTIREVLMCKSLLFQLLASNKQILETQQQILALLKQTPGMPVALKFTIGVPVHNEGGEPMSSPFPLGDDENVNVTFQNPLVFVDDAGNPAASPVDSNGNPVTAALSFAADQSTILEVTPDTTGLVPNVKALGPLGTANLVVTVTFTATVAGGTPPPSFTQNVPFQVAATAPKGVAFSVGTPIHN